MPEETRKQPNALKFFFFTELWERFGFYIVQGLLVLFMSNYFGLDDNTSYSITGLFAGLVYISPFFGGYLADTYFGPRRVILAGGIILAFGYALLGFSTQLTHFFFALSIIIIGNGFFKPNISSLLGAQYTLNDPRRDTGYTIFYIGSNIGSMLSGASGYIIQYFGSHASFYIASIGMLIGLATFQYGRKFMQFPKKEEKIAIKQFLVTIAVVLAIIALINYLFYLRSYTYLLPIAGILLLSYMFRLWIAQGTYERKYLLILYLFILSSIIFWALLLQVFSSGNLYVERFVRKEIFHIPLSTTVFYASEGFFIVVVGPLFAYLWNWLKDKNPSPIGKFITGLFFPGFCFLLLAYSTNFAVHNDQISPVWIFAAYLLITIGELLLSPIALSAISELAPRHLVSIMMGIWFVATGFGGLLSGQLAKLASLPEVDIPNDDKLIIYRDAFTIFGFLPMVVAIVLLILYIFVQKHYRKSSSI